MPTLPISVARAARARTAALVSAALLLAGCPKQWRTPVRALPPANEDRVDAPDVRAARARSNAAIAARDLDAIAGTMVDDIVVTAGSGALVLGRDSVRAVFARQFGDSAFIGYVREPSLVEIAAGRRLAAEHGGWTGRWRRSDGVQAVRGSYLAMWRRTADGWRIRSELFVTLGCTGSRACATPTAPQPSPPPSPSPAPSR